MSRSVRHHLSRLLGALVLLCLAASCPSSHDPDPGDPRPPCPEGDGVDFGEDCLEQAQCEGSTCGRLAGICVEYRWTCGTCNRCFFEQVEHVEDSFLPCNMDTGYCEY